MAKDPEIGKVDIEGAVAEPLALKSEDEHVEVDDTIMQLKAELKELREKLSSLRKQSKSVSKQQRKTIQEEIAAFEKEEAKKRALLEEESNKATLSKLVSEQRTQDERTAALRAKKLAKKAVKSEERAAKELEAEEMASAMPNLSRLERESFEQILGSENLLIYDIEPDGNCLFAAISHQLEFRYRKHYDQSGLRNLAADYIMSNAEKYAGFVEDDDQSLESYCQKLRGNDLWGGHIEIDSIVSSLGIPIKVYQADSAPMVFGSEMVSGDMHPITICFQKYAYSLGEHYDSLVDK